MNKFDRFLEKAANRKRYSLRRILAGVVVFATTYALILPAITIESDVAEDDPGLVLNSGGQTETQNPAVILEKIIEDRIEGKAYNLRRILGKVHGSRNQKEEEMTEDEAIFFESCLLTTENEDLERKYKVLKEMKSKYNLAVKFFTETKNQEQLDLTYKEYEAFHETFEQFKFFYKFKIESIDPKALNQLSEEEQKMIQDPNNLKSIEHQKANICDYIFGNGKFNLELYKYALDKVFEEYRIKMEEEKKREEAMRPKVSWSEYLMKISKGNFGIYLSICFVLFTIGAIGFQFYSSGSAGAM